jgi:hypothetical protein
MPKKPIQISEVEFLSGVYFLKGGSTPAGYPIFSKSKTLIEGIRKEAIEKGGISAKTFGLFSAYCTFRDAVEGKHFITKELTKKLYETDHLLHEKDCVCYWSLNRENYLEQIKKVYDKTGVNIDQSQDEKIITGIENYLKSLPAEKLTVMCLLNGMFGIPLTAFLLLENGNLSFEKLNSIFNSPSQPDAWDEYGLAPEIMIIKAFADSFNN